MSAFIFVAAIVAGGIGAAARYLLGEWLALPADRYPWALLIANTIGGFGIVMVMLVLQGPAVTITAMGFLGGFTTFSSVSTAAGKLWHANRRLSALWVMMSLFIATLAGATLANLLFGSVVAVAR